MSTEREPSRKPYGKLDVNSIDEIQNNEQTGAKKVMIIEPVVKKAVLGTDRYDFGSYVKVTGTTYTLDCIGKVYLPISTYRIGAVVTNGLFIYIATENDITGAFNANKWRKVSDKSIGPISIVAGATVCTGKWHNTVSVPGFLIEEDSIFSV